MPLVLFIVVVTLLSLSTPIAVSYLIDYRLHEGVNYFRRRRVLKQGVAAKAKVLSSNILTKATGSRLKSAHSVIYEVSPPGAPAFRAKGIEVLFSSEVTANGLRDGQTVDVRYEPVDHIVVLVRIDPKQALLEREQKIKEKEEALLRGGSDH